MGQNRGKQFEDQIRSSFESVDGTAVLRLNDPQGGQSGVSNICDFIVYHYPTMYFVECKSTYGNTLSIHSNNPKRCYGAISNAQWNGLYSMSHISGVRAGVIVWFIEHDVTAYLPIGSLVSLRCSGHKSVHVDDLYNISNCYIIPCTKRRILFDYDFREFLRGGANYD